MPMEHEPPRRSPALHGRYWLLVYPVLIVLWVLMGIRILGTTLSVGFGLLLLGMLALIWWLSRPEGPLTALRHRRRSPSARVRWWRLDDWFRVVRADGSPVGGTGPGRSYDAEPPFWCRYSPAINFFLMAVVTYGTSYREYGAVAVGLTMGTVFAFALVGWERRHRVT